MGRAKRPLLRSEPISTSSFIGDLSYRVEMLDALEIRQRDEDLANALRLRSDGERVSQKAPTTI